MKPLILKTLIGLLAATGLRPGEAAALEDRDVDLRAGVLVIRDSKFGKSRQVPVHESTVVALRNYARVRDRVIPRGRSSSFFVSDAGPAMNLLPSGVDLTVIALWVGHESIETTHTYLHADMAMKEKALSRTAQGTTAPKRYRPHDKRFTFLETL